MDINNKLKVHWACRRGMRELDILLMPFFEREYEQLDSKDKQLFVSLLAYQDPQLFSWFMNQSRPDSKELNRMIDLIKLRNKQNDQRSV